MIAVKENPVTKNLSVQTSNQITTTLYTPRLLLRGLKPADAQALYEYRSLPEVTRFQGFSPETVSDAIRFIKEEISHEIDQPDTWYQLGIFLQEDDTMIGDLGIHFLPEHKEAEIGVTVAPIYQGRGFATEAVGCALDFLFNSLHKNKVVASVDPKNSKSMSLMTGVGFQLTGIYKNTVLFRGEWTDDAVFEMTSNQWLNKPKHSL
jgi:RimJ/RimL family protein N-acetyltransferase